jgi:alkylhydroperoxidase/carboxymuconolactone decarboxylase family protein YurZ
MTDENKTYPATEEHRAKGDWNPLWEQFQQLDADFLEAYLAFRSVPQKNGPLPQKYKELILIAINAATTHLYGPGVRRHMQNALKAGATRDEILETIQLTTVMGIHSCNLAIPILMEEAAKMEESLPGND